MWNITLTLNLTLTLIRLNLTVWNITLPALHESAFTSFFQFQYQHLPFLSNITGQGGRPGEVRGDLSNYYKGSHLAQMQAAYLNLLCERRIPPVGYTMLRPPDAYTALDASRCTGVVPATTGDTAARGTTAQPRAAAPFSIMAIDNLFNHTWGTNYSEAYYRQLWADDTTTAAL